MKFRPAPSKAPKYDTTIRPVESGISQKEFDKSHPKLKGTPVPETGSWHFIRTGDTTEILFAFDAKSNAGAISKQFRKLASKTRQHWTGKVCIDISRLGENLGPALTGMLMATYEIGTFKTGDQKKSPSVAIDLSGKVDDEKSVLHSIVVRAEAQMRAMHLVDLPPNKKTPTFLGKWAGDAAKKYGYDCDVWDQKKIIAQGLHALNAVGKGSENPPVFIVCQYWGNPKSKETDVALVGKGITFDTGGISIKPSANLHYMKSDMAGAAAMLSTIEVAARLEIPLNIACVVPSAENSVDALSYRPGDVIESYSGKTIEIIDTDAEGRLALADGLAWVGKNLKPKVMIDMATLTGSSVRALGKEAAALYSDNESLSKSLQEAGQLTGEKLWPMPLWADYDSYIHSDVADVSNLPLSPVAGSIAAAKFLQVFANGHNNWAHIDMPGMSFGDSPFAKMKSATGYGVQLLTELMLGLIKNGDISRSK